MAWGAACQVGAGAGRRALDTAKEVMAAAIARAVTAKAPTDAPAWVAAGPRGEGRRVGSAPTSD